jgi:formamidopyrimidine-DNA glycosylase
MPELPEVETIRHGLARRLTGRRLARVVVRRSDLRVPLPERFAERLQGRRVERIGRRGKYLLAELDDGQVWILHLGMSGRLVLAEGAPRPLGVHDHVLIESEEGTRLIYSDHRRFGLMTLCPLAALQNHPLLENLGPEPLDPSFDGAALMARLAGKRTPIKAALVDQRVVAGVGNIYACEALFRAALSPRRLASSVKGVRAQRLAQSIKSVLEDAIAAGGSSLRDYVQSDGELGYFQHQFAVYGRAGQPCPGCDCRHGIRRLVQGNRSTFYCAKRQR